MKVTHSILLAVVPVLFFCSMAEYVFDNGTSATSKLTSSPRGNTPHPPGLPSVWKGRNVSELVATLGEPDIILETAVRGIVIYGDTPSVMYVYCPESGSWIHEVYVVELDSGEILAHQHR